MKILILLLALFLVFPLMGQEEVRADHRLATLEQLNSFLLLEEASNSSVSFQNFLKKLERKQLSFTREKDFIQYVFTKTHQTYLKKFEAYSSFNALFRDGSYHCLTGTILFSILFDHFNIQYEVIETNHHIFLVAETAQGKVLIEATDPLQGYVDTAAGIESRMESYKTNSLSASSSGKVYYQFTFQLFNTVSMDEMRGLLYYNKAVVAFNHKKLTDAIFYLSEAQQHYTSSRIEEFSQILLLTIRQSEVEAEKKEAQLKAVFSILQKNFPVVASASAY